MPLVRFVGLDGGAEHLATRGESILTLSLREGIPHAHECRGRARCTTCRVKVHAQATPLPTRSPAEQEIADACNWTTDIRLACQTPIQGDMTVERLVRDHKPPRRDFSVAQDDTQAHECEMVVLFADIADFSTFSARHLPYDTVHLLNRFYHAAGQPILDYGGRIDNYLGDGMLALFEVTVSPQETCRRALRAVLSIRRRVTEVNDFARKHLDFDFKIRIGLHRGPVIVGNIGHPESHRATVIGNAVNIASRIEAANKLFGTDLLASEEFIRDNRDDLILKAHPATPLPGYAEPFDLYEIEAFADFSPALELEHSLARVMETGTRICDLFYDELFAADEKLRAFFIGSDIDRLKAKLLDALQLIIACAREPEALTARLTEVGRFHDELGVKKEHYFAAQTALRKALRKVLGSRMSATEELSWSQTLAAVVTVMSTSSLDLSERR